MLLSDQISSRVHVSSIAKCLLFRGFTDITKHSNPICLEEVTKPTINPIATKSVHYSSFIVHSTKPRIVLHHFHKSRMNSESFSSSTNNLLKLFSYKGSCNASQIKIMRQLNSTTKAARGKFKT